jgi:hypothetical protein
MENMNNNPVAEEAVVESPIEEAPAVEAPAPVVEEAPAEPVIEEAPAEPAQEAINAPAYKSNSEEVPALGAVDNGVMGTTSVRRSEPRTHEKPKAEDSVEKVIIYSTKNVNWQEVGKIYKGYNIVTKDASEQWLTRPHVRIASPEEAKKVIG